MAKEPDISVRRWIMWHGSEPEEPTSTLVLTSPTSKYVDIRVLLPSSKGSTLHRRPPATTTDALRNCSLHIPETSISQLDWAFCGTSSRTRATADRPAHGVWKRWVDSWQPNSKAHLLKDEGDLFPYQEGNEELELEKGSMINPSTQQMTAYEELWASGSAIGTNDAVNEERICVVLRTVNEMGHDNADSEDGEEKGMIIRVGQWIQGIVKQGDNLFVERWLWTPPGDVESANDPAGDSVGAWKRVVRMQKTAVGDVNLTLPCTQIMSLGPALIEGHIINSVENIGARWKVEEVVRW